MQICTTHPLLLCCCSLMIFMCCFTHGQVLKRGIAWKIARALLLSAIFSPIHVACWNGKSQWIHSILYTLWARIRETIVVWDGLEHIEPDSALFAFEMSWLESDTIKWANCATRCSHFWSMAQSDKFLTLSAACHAIPLFHVVAFSLFYLTDEVIQVLVSLSCFDFAKLLTVFFRNAHLHLC